MNIPKSEAVLSELKEALKLELQVIKSARKAIDEALAEIELKFDEILNGDHKQ